jgi:hypothetical protein
VARIYKRQAMLICRPPVAMREAETLDELREIVREMWKRMIRLEDEIAGRKRDCDDDEDLDAAP